jgi:hypothetical protein
MSRPKGTSKNSGCFEVRRQSSPRHGQACPDHDECEDLAAYFAFWFRGAPKLQFGDVLRYEFEFSDSKIKERPALALRGCPHSRA